MLGEQLINLFISAVAVQIINSVCMILLSVDGFMTHIHGHHYGSQFPRCLRSAVNCRIVRARRAVLAAANVEKLTCHALHCASVLGRATGIKFFAIIYLKYDIRLSCLAHHSSIIILSHVF